MSDPMSDEWRICNSCKQEKSINEFYKNKNGMFGVRSECKKCSSIKNKIDRTIDPNKYSKWERKSYLNRTYGLSVDEYSNLVDKQKGRCAICNSLPNRKDKNGDIKLLVDHCHYTGNVRGLLCHNCNVALGLFKDNIASLQKAITYLKGNKDV